MISEAARKYVTVALSGTGGDELFAGYERYRGALVAEQYRKMPKVLRQVVFNRLIKQLPEFATAGLWVDRLKRFAEGDDLPLPQRYQRYLEAFSEHEKTELFNEDVLLALHRSEKYETPIAMQRVGKCDDPLDWMLLSDIETYLPDDELRKTDRLSMRHSLEVRVPFLDHKVVEFAAAIPGKYKLNFMTRKFVLLKAMEGVIPRKILKRTKQGFSIPLSDWLRGPLRDFLHDNLAPKSLNNLGTFNVRAVSRLIEEHESGTKNHETKLWTLLVFARWHSLYMPLLCGEMPR
jgi:asparagine synthase (glutamine-hydrolysing)